MARVKTFTNGGKLFPGDLNAIQDDYDGKLLANVPVGTILMSLLTNAPTGFLALGNGLTLSRSAYPALWTAAQAEITASNPWFGNGDGSTTFTITTIAGRTPIAVGPGTGLTARTIGQKGGAETHQLTSAQMPAHSHDFQLYSSQAGGGQPLPPQSLNNNAGTLVLGSSGDAIKPTGGDGSHPNMQPWAAMNFIVRHGN